MMKNFTLVLSLSLLCAGFSCAQSEEKSKDAGATIIPQKLPKEEKEAANDSSVLTGEKKLEIEAKKESKEPEWAKNFSNLAANVREDYMSKVRLAERLNAQKRTIECLRVLEEVEKIYEQNPQIYNLRGACYIELRDFENAIKNFDKALSYVPNNMSFLFNRAEADYVGKNYELAIKRLDDLIKKMPEQAVGMRSLLQFKKFISLYRLGKIDEAQKLVALYDVHADTPYYFYVRAVEFFHKKETAKAEREMQAASRVYGNTELIRPFYDTISESGYVLQAMEQEAEK